MFSPCCFLIRLSWFHDKWVSHHYPVTDQSSHVFPRPINALAQLRAAFRVPLLAPLGATEQPSLNRVPGKVWIMKVSVAAQAQLWQPRHNVSLVELLLHPCYSLRNIPDGGQAPSLLILLAICSHQQLGSHPTVWRRFFREVTSNASAPTQVLNIGEAGATEDNVSLTNPVTRLQHFTCCSVQRV